MVERRLLRRVAAILFHRRAGFSANGMGVWKVPEERIMELGHADGAFRGISHCYQRPTYADWPYSVFTMAHGRSKEECDAILDSIAEQTGITERATLYSSTEFKKIRLLYFTDDYRDWERGTPASELVLYDDGAHARVADPGRGQLAGPGDALDRPRPDLHRLAASGSRINDVDGNSYIDWVCSWGPLILGHADPAVRGRDRRGGRARHHASARRPRARSSWPSEVATGCRRSRWCA